MKKCFIGVILLMCISAFTKGAPIDLKRAREIASSHWQIPTSLRSGNSNELTLIYTSSGIPLRGKTLKQEDYYVFAHQGEGKKGFVIVSGDDNLPEVLGYSDNNEFAVENIPVQLKSWLERYSRWVQEARKGGGSFASNVLRRERTPISPLLYGILWDQGSPYNLHTPKSNGKNMPVGCVATALGQIMRYHCWPRKGKGKITYTSDNKKLSLQFATAYDWAHMPNDITDNSPKAEREAVSLLLRDVGYASQMQYHAEYSATHSEKAFFGLRNYLRYANTMRFCKQDYYTYDAWVTTILDELKSKRPLYYAGGAIGIGHAFVCDGYDGKGRFHFNWGWNGVSNGYFVLTDLLPSTQGIGGGGAGGYVLGCEMIAGIQPFESAESAIEVTSDELILPKNSQNKSKPFSIKFGTDKTYRGTFYYGVDTVTVAPAVQVIDKTGTVVLEKHSVNFYSCPSGFGFNSKFSLSLNVKDLPNGTYMLRSAMFFKDRNRYYGAHMSVLRKPSYITIEDDNVHFNVTKTKASLTLASAQPITLNIGVKNQQQVRIRNNGQYPYKAYVAGIYSENEDQLSILPQKKEDLLFNRSLYLEPGEEQTLELIINGPQNTNQKFLHILYNEFGGNHDWYLLPDNDTYYPGTKCTIPIALTVKPQYPIAPAMDNGLFPYGFTIVDAPTQHKNGEPMTVKIKIKAQQQRGLVTNIYGAIFLGNSQYYSALVNFGAIILKPEEVKEYTITQDFFLNPSSSPKYIFKFYDSKAKRWIGRSFSFVVEGKLPDALPIPDPSTLPPEADEDTAVESPQSLVGLAIGPNPATTFLNIYCNEGLLGRTIKLAIYDTLGQQVFVTEKSAESVYTIQTSSWPKGLYILQAYCEGRRVVHRFMVQ